MDPTARTDSSSPPASPPPKAHPLRVFFAPKAVAVIGATETAGSVGRTILWNLISSPFGGTVYPVNPKRPGVLGIRAYPKIGDVPDRVDLAVIVTPAKTVPGLVSECIAAGVRGIVIISAGFKETGPAGVELERQILSQAREAGVRVIGPNCLGVMSPLSGLNATFASGIARPGNVGFVSQSGALCTSVLDWSLRERVGFSAFVSIGSMLDVDWGDLIDYLGRDPHTESIVIYMESIGNAQSFISAAREIALAKPIIVIKAGRTAAASKAAASHTGSLTGSDEVLDAAFRRCGVLRVNEIEDLFSMTEVLGKQPRPTGRKLAILTNAGGPGVLATDALIGGGGELAELSPETMAKLDEILPPHWSHNNPIDILGDAGPDRYAKAVDIVANAPGTDGILVVLTPQAMTDPTGTAAEIARYAKIPGKPIIASWMGGADVAEGEDLLNRAGIPSFAYPDAAAKAFNYLWRYSHNLRLLYETPSLSDDEGGAPDRAAAAAVVQKVRASGRTILTESESKEVLSAYRIPVVETRIARSEAEAAEHAERLGYPVVVKLYSETITHKTDVGGVALDLPDAEAVRRAYRTIEANVAAKKGREHFQGVTVQPMVKLEGYELILGSSADNQLGPVLLFGTGGQLVEVFRDRALAIPPLNTTLARRLMEETKIFTALKSVRGRRPVPIAQLEHLLVRFSQLVVEEPWISEIDINPLLASPDGIVALDARVVLYPPDHPEDRLPRPAIRAYPSAYVRRARLADGTEVTLRPIRPEDEPLLVEFHEGLSDATVFQRYLTSFPLSERVSHERLARICLSDIEHEIALVAERRDPASGRREILGVARLARERGTREGEFSVVVVDRFQGKGLGTQLLSYLFEVARKENVRRVSAEMLPDNPAMRALAAKLGLVVGPSPGPGRLHLYREL